MNNVRDSELEAGVNLQTWVMLLDFFTPSSAALNDNGGTGDLGAILCSILRHKINENYLNNCHSMLRVARHFGYQ